MIFFHCTTSVLRALVLQHCCFVVEIQHFIYMHPFKIFFFLSVPSRAPTVVVLSSLCLLFHNLFSSQMMLFDLRSTGIKKRDVKALFGGFTESKEIKRENCILFSEDPYCLIIIIIIIILINVLLCTVLLLLTPL